MRVLSLGAGVQSSAIAMMMKHGEIEKADLVMFADTCWEPKAVYEWLAWLVPNMGMPFVQVRQGQGLAEAIDAVCHNAQGRKRASSLPLFTAGGGRIIRQCTWDYKVLPIRRELKRFTKKAVMIRGISFDERHRAKPSDVKWITHEHPLVDMKIDRQGCARWMVRHGYQIPPRSACVTCPNRCNAEWQKMRDLFPEDWEEACKYDELMRENLPGMKEPVFIHRQLVPLREADLYAGVNPDQLPLGGDGWADCEGLCGV